MGILCTRTPQASARSTRSVRFLLALSIASWLTIGCGKSPSERIGAPSYPWADESMDEGVYVGNPRAEVPGAQLTIARSMPKFRRCFEEADAHGKVSLRLIIAHDGVVKRARGEGPVPRRVLRCVEATAERTRFSPPEGSQIAELDVPVAYYRQ